MSVKAGTISSNNNLQVVTTKEINDMIDSTSSSLTNEYVKTEAIRFTNAVNSTTFIKDNKLKEDEAGSLLYDNLKSLIYQISPLFRVLIENNYDIASKIEENAFKNNILQLKWKI